MNLLINTSIISLRVWVSNVKTHPKIVSRSFHSKPYSLHSNKLTTSLKYTKIIIRSMISGKSPLAARMAYHSPTSLTKKSVIDNTHRNDQEALVKETVVYSLDNSKGTPQQKEAIISHISSKRFPSSYFYNPYKEITNNVNISWDYNTTQDFRILKELSVLSKFIAFGEQDISEIYCNNDDKSYKFPYQNQTNPDWIATIKTKNEGQKLIEYKKYPFDEKGGLYILVVSLFISFSEEAEFSKKNIRHSKDLGFVYGLIKASLSLYLKYADWINLLITIIPWLYLVNFSLQKYSLDARGTIQHLNTSNKQNVI